MTRDVAYYLARGFDEATARYYADGRRRAVGVRPAGGRRVLVTYDGGEGRLFDVAPLIEEGTVFAFLADDDAFSRVRLDENHDVAWDVDPAVDSDVVWGNKVDLSADVCYLEGTPA